MKKPTNSIATKANELGFPHCLGQPKRVQGILCNRFARSTSRDAGAVYVGFRPGKTKGEVEWVIEYEQLTRSMFMAAVKLAVWHAKVAIRVAKDPRKAVVWLPREGRWAIYSATAWDKPKNPPLLPWSAPDAPPFAIVSPDGSWMPGEGFSFTLDHAEMLMEGRKVRCQTDIYSPTLSEGAIGTIMESYPMTAKYVVSFSGKRLYELRADQIRLATPDEVAADANDPDMDERFS